MKNNRPVYLLTIICLCVIFVAALIHCAEAAFTEPLTAEELRIDYAAVMQSCVLCGDVTGGRDAALRRDAKIDALGLAYSKVDFDELNLLAKIITAEAGSDWLPREWKMGVGEVLLNRVASPEFPDSMAEVIHQPGQYYGADSSYFQRLLPYEDCIDAAWALLSGERVFNDPSVVFQANFPQGGGTALHLNDKLLGGTWFCYSAKPWLYGEG